MNEKVFGIVIKQTDYRENAALLCVLSETYGKITLVAEGVRKLNSKTAGRVQPCMKSEFTIDYRPDRTMFRVKGVRLEEARASLRSDIVRSAAAMMLCEAADVLTYADVDPEVQKEAYHLLDESLSMLEEGKKPDLVIALFLSVMMDLNGIAPNVDSCVLCGKREAAAVSAEDGGFLCPACAAKRGVPVIPREQLRAFRYGVKAAPRHYEAMLEAAPDMMFTLQKQVDIIRLHTGADIRSLNLFKRFFCH